MKDKATEYCTEQYIYFISQTAESKALYGQGSWMPIDKWELTGGYRYSWDRKDYHGNEFGRFAPGQYVFIDPALFHRHTYKYNEGTYKGNLSFIPTDDIMTYLQYSKGYKVGNIDFSGREVPPEFLDAWELGFKSRWFDNRLQANAAIYYYLYDNFNQWVFPWQCRSDANGDHFCDDVASNPNEPPFTGGPDGRITGEDRIGRSIGVAPGGSEQKGVSVNLAWLITRNDRMTLTGSWSENKYKDYNIARAILEIWPEADSPYTEAGQQDRSGLEFGGAPIRGNIGYVHTQHIGSDFLTLTGNLFYQGEGIDQLMRFGRPDQYYMAGTPDYWTGDVSATYTSSYGMRPGTIWHLRFWCNNVWDNDALAFRMFGDSHFMYGYDAYLPGTGTIMGSYILPRTYGLAFGINW
jgi:outer membrane receptor protein involved in Fe transport